MTVAIRKARQRARKAENGEKEIRFYASPKAQEWAKQEFPSLSVHEAAKWVFEAARLSQEGEK
jgi:ABC-type Fe3+ transport system substrate-binding protein